MTIADAFFAVSSPMILVATFTESSDLPDGEKDVFLILPRA